MRSLSSLGSRSLAHRPGRTLLTGLGVALGVALLFGVLVANRSVNRSFERATERIPTTFNVSLTRSDGAVLSDDVIVRTFALPHVSNGEVQPDRTELRVAIRGIAVTDWQNQIATPALGPDIVFGRIITIGGEQQPDNGFREFRESVEGTLAAFSAVSLFAAGFLIYLTFTTAVLERTALYGLLRALGAHPSQIRQAVVVESLTLGAVSSVVGLLLGFGIASLITRLLAEALGVATPPAEIQLWAVTASITLGVATSVVSALIPARRAGAVEPVAAMRGDHRAAGALSRWWIAGAAMLPAGVGLGVRFPSLRVAPVSATLIVVGSVLLVPPLLKPVARALGVATTRLSRNGRIPVMHLVKERSRSAYTLALIMVVLAMAYSLAAADTSMHDALDEVFDHQYRTDLVVFRAGAPYQPSELAAISRQPHVRAMTALGFGRTTVADRTANVVVIDPASYFGMLSFAWRDGDDRSAAEALRRGGAALVPADLAARAGVRRGDPILLSTPDGSRTLVVAGTFVRFGFLPDMGVVVGPTDAVSFGVAGPVALRLNTVEGTSTSEIVDEVLAVPGPGFTYTQVQTVAQLKEVVIGSVDRYFRLFFAVVLVALIVGLLGLANTLGMSIFERTREVGVLRATGMHRSEIGRMVVVESITLALAAFVLSIPLGMIQAQLLTRGTREQLGFGGGGSQPVWWLVPAGVLATVVAALAALLPARRAGRV
ncbi:MAG: putative transport system permease protein, partial [Acidimicrobiaceae bacterium]